jgi:hypothetical protein
MQRMKKFIYCVLIALLAISCNKTEDLEENSCVVIPKTLSGCTPVFESQGADSKTRALAEYLPESWEESEKPNTRTYAVVDQANAGEYIQYWSEGDAISVFFTTANLKYTLTGFNGNEWDYGFFQLAGEEIKGDEINTDYFYSVYPYKEDTEMFDYGCVAYTFPATQHYNTELNGDSYFNGENGMIAKELKSEYDEVLYFQNFCSYLQLRLYSDAGVSKSVKKITLTANNPDDKIAGRGDIEYDGEVPVVYMYYDATNKITLDCGNGVELSQDKENPTKFWFVVPGGFTFIDGFTVTVIFSDNTYFKKSRNTAIGIERSHIKPMATFEPESIEPNKPIRYKYNSGNKEEAYPLKNTFYDENGSALDIVDQVYDEETGEWVILLSGELKTIGGNSFTDTSLNLEYIKIDNGEKPVTISDFAFYNCTADDLIILNNVDAINESAFTGSTITDLNIYGDVTTIKNSAGTGSSIENINITGSVQIIEEQAFSGCGDLQTINIDNVETIGYRAFYKCSNLTQVSVPGVTYVDAGAFRSCISLETIDLGSVVTIEDNAFMDCSSLTEVIISENCTLIGEGAFCNAVSLQTVYCYAAAPPFIKTDNSDKSYVFDNTHPNLVIYIPKGARTKYSNRKYFANHKYDDPKIKATVNWWQQEYTSKLTEMTN